MTIKFSWLLLPACGLAVLVTIGSGQETSATSKRPFRVLDSIEMTRILNPEDRPNPSIPIHPAEDSAGVASPDGAQIATLLTNGDVSHDTNIFRLVVFDTPSLFTKPRSREVLRLTSTSSRAGIAKVKWLADSRRVAFLGERANELPQIWILDIQSLSLIQLTRHQTVITNYDISPDGSAWIYSAEAAPAGESPEDHERGFVFNWKLHSLEDVLKGRYAPAPPRSFRFEEVFVGGTGNSPGTRVAQPAEPTLSLSISPDGMHAVEGLQIQSAPEHWSRYEGQLMPQRVAASRNGELVTDIDRYFVIDTATAKIRPLMDAPATSGTPALWMQDGREVILCETYLPLSIPGSAHAGWRNAASVTLEDGRVAIIRSVPNSDKLLPLEWRAESNRLVLKEQHTGRTWVYVKQADTWSGTEGGRQSGVRIGVAQTINDPPELEAQEWSDGLIKRRAVISHVNPQFETIRIAPVKAFEWKAKDSLPWRALMYLPPDYRQNTRYPLVIQTHGYSETLFLPDGLSSTTSMAAQALANSGMIVIQSLGPTGWANERTTVFTDQWSSGIEALIDTLNRQGIIDPTRVGLTGWSYTGWLVDYFLTHSKYAIRAAVTADNVDYGYLQYLITANNSVYTAGLEEPYHGSPWEKRDAWLENPGFNLERINTPLRLEVEGGSPLDAWEIYAGLRRLRKPAELVIIPDSPHSLVRPWHRMTSQGGSVDWFRFWLQGYEDPDPAKAEQYVRWREMRDQQKNQAGSKK